MPRSRGSEGLDSAKLVLITNASLFHRPVVQHALAVLDANHGEIWAKLDAGTASYFEKVERTRIPFQRILDNLDAASRNPPPRLFEASSATIDGKASESEIEGVLRLPRGLDAGTQGDRSRSGLHGGTSPRGGDGGAAGERGGGAHRGGFRSSVEVPVEGYYGIRS
ncbi:MAG: hypothetical protein U0794_21715 [Isosphaeraceae bacterium]